MKIGANFARNFVNLLSRTANLGGYLTTGYSTFKFAMNPNLGDGLDAAAGFGSIIFWEFGVTYLGIDFMKWASGGERQQIQENIYNNKNPLNGVYCPGLGTTFY